MNTKTTDLINKYLKEELNQQQPVVPQQQPVVPQQQQPQQIQQPTQQQDQNQNGDNQEEQKVEVYIPLHDGRFTNRIFTTSKGVTLKILDDSIENDINVIMELENNPNTYFQVSV